MSELKPSSLNIERFNSISVLISSFLALSSEVPEHYGFYTLDPIQYSFFGIAVFGITLMFLEKFARDIGRGEEKIRYVNEIWFKDWNWIITALLIGLVGVYAIDYVGLWVAPAPIVLLIMLSYSYHKYV